LNLDILGTFQAEILFFAHYVVAHHCVLCYWCSFWTRYTFEFIWQTFWVWEL